MQSLQNFLGKIINLENIIKNFFWGEIRKCGIYFLGKRQKSGKHFQRRNFFWEKSKMWETLLSKKMLENRPEDALDLLVFDCIQCIDCEDWRDWRECRGCRGCRAADCTDCTDFTDWNHCINWRSEKVWVTYLLTYWQLESKRC